MKMLFRFVPVMSVGIFMGFSQQLVSEAPGHVEFVRHLLVSIADPDHDPKVCALNEYDIGILYGLDKNEAALLRAAGTQFAAAKLRFVASEATLLGGKSTVADSDRVALGAFARQFQAETAAIAVQFLGSVRPQTAVLLRRQGDLISGHAAVPLGGEKP